MIKVSGSSLHLAFIVATVLSAGCATIINGTSQKIHVESDPSGARVFTAELKEKDDGPRYNDRREIGVTPITVKVARKDGAILLEKEGYKSASVPLSRHVSGWLFGNLIIGGAFGISTDFSTGGAQDYDPGHYLVELTPILLATQTPQTVRPVTGDAIPPPAVPPPVPYSAAPSAAAPVASSPVAPTTGTRTEPAPARARSPLEVHTVVDGKKAAIDRLVDQIPGTAGSGVVTVGFVVRPDGFLEQLTVVTSTFADPRVGQAVIAELAKTQLQAKNVLPLSVPSYSIQVH